MSSQLKYENVRRYEDNDDSSSTEVEESLIGDEKRMAGEEFGHSYSKKSKRTTCLSILKHANWFLDTILLLVIVGLMVHDRAAKPTSGGSENEVGGDMTGVGIHSRQLLLQIGGVQPI